MGGGARRSPHAHDGLGRRPAPRAPSWTGVAPRGARARRHRPRQHGGARGGPGAAAACPGLTVVAGLEINCDVEGGEIHILGYGVDHEAAVVPGFPARASAPSAWPASTASRRAWPSSGMPIDPAEVFAIVKEGSPGRPHVAQVMVGARLREVRCARRSTATSTPAGPRDVPSPAPDAGGGRAGHPACPRRARVRPPRPGRARRAIPELSAGGLMGIEATTPSTRPRSAAAISSCAAGTASSPPEALTSTARRPAVPIRPGRRPFRGRLGGAPGADGARARRVNVQIFGFRNDADTRKALRFFSERRIAVHFVDLAERPASPRRAAPLHGAAGRRRPRRSREAAVPGRSGSA